MTTTTILQIILGLLLALIIKKFYYSIVNKGIDIDIEKQKKIDETVKAEKEKADKERYWLIRNQKDLEETLAEIENIIKRKGEKDYDFFSEILKLAKKLSHDLDSNIVAKAIKLIYPEIEGGFIYWQTKYDGSEWESPIDGLVWENTEFEKPTWEQIEAQFSAVFLDKNDKWGKEFDSFRHLLLCYYFKKPELEKYIEDLSSQYRGDQQELQKKQDELLQKQQELELRKAKMIKMEASQKILNSELVKKINKEIREDFLQFIKTNLNNKN
jgi:hypothetical protein